MSSRFCQFPNNGWKLTNELGYILSDYAFSVVQARELVVCSDCLCPVKKNTCLRLPCDLLSNRCQNITIPLFNAADRAPFKIKKGTVIEKITVMKRPGACLDDCLKFVLGTICGSDCDRECDPQRWASESCPLSGAQLNKCGVVVVDATRKCNVDCPLYLCRTGQCPGQCGPRYEAKPYPCRKPNGPSRGEDHDSCSDCGKKDGGRDRRRRRHHDSSSDSSSDSESESRHSRDCHDRGCGHDEHECPCTVDDNGCCVFCGGCDFAGGEFADCLIGLTVLEGDIPQDSLLIGVETVEQCCQPDCLDEEFDGCFGVPRWAHGGF